jgi:hypothetical protein
MSTTVYLHITPTEADELIDLISHVEHGYVIVGWDYDESLVEDGADSDDGNVPILDRSDRSGHPRYALAQAISAACALNIYGADLEAGYVLCVKVNANEDLIEHAASQANVKTSRA